VEGGTEQSRSKRFGETWQQAEIGTRRSQRIENGTQKPAMVEVELGGKKPAMVEISSSQKASNG
jgi:hypothetical protein